jgi:Fe-S oxidoreductase
VVTACPGCLLNLKAGARRHGLPIQVLHISKLMAGPIQGAPIREGPDR